MARVVRTVVVESVRLPRKVFRVFIELEGMYRNMVEQLVLYAVREGVKSFTKLRALRYKDLRRLYPHLPSHYVYTACQDAGVRAKSFLKLKKLGLAEREYPEVKKVSIWLDDHLWRLDGCTRVKIATHKEWISVDLESHKQFWRYLNGGWRLASETRIKLDKRSRQLIIYLTFVKDIEEYKPRGFIAVDVNENNVTMLLEGNAFLFETDLKKIVLGYYYRRKRVQEKYDRLYGVNSRAEKRVLRRLKEREKKNDVKWKIANIIVRVAREKQYAVVLERLGRNPAKKMVEKIKDSQLRHRIFQASFKSVQRAVEEKGREYGVPVVYVDPRNTSKLCPIHNTPIVYSNGSRIGRCSRGGELWHRDVVATWNLLLRARLGDGSNAPSLDGLSVDGSPMPLGSTATHEPTEIRLSLWARWKSLDTREHERTPMIIQGQTGLDVSSSIERVKRELSKLREDSKIIILSHHPPSSSKTDLAQRIFHIGLREFNQLYTSHRIVLHMHGHVHESPGWEFIGETLVVNPGALKHGRYALIDLEKREVTLNKI